jgi:thioredoxin 1
VREIDDAGFEQAVLRAEGPVVVDFGAPWCKPCEAVGRVLQALEAEHGGAVEFVHVDVDANPDWATRFDVLSLPTVLVFAGGGVRARVLGAQPRKRFEQALAEVLPAG